MNTFLFGLDEMAKHDFQNLMNLFKVFKISAKEKELGKEIRNAGDRKRKPPAFLRESSTTNDLNTKEAMLGKLAIKTFRPILSGQWPNRPGILGCVVQNIFTKSVSEAIYNQHFPMQRMPDLLMVCKRQSIYPYESAAIPFPRQDMANLSNLRIGTVIRTLRKRSESKKVKFFIHHIYFYYYAFHV